ncbi:uncharacterized protein LOC119190628 [Manduca sexta]|uniref:uncharacterized protein LOC119189307 n=2 Tax=Manduca sexta TaxID=7130 RepID=UPI00188F91CD|nr:uncharacterized protein LOC119189307 [Manduca sexta]XP_037298811.1 uncharacterized protein LOC119190628 [Manduca sexta]
MSIGKIREFDIQSGTWSSYVDRLEMYFKANDIKDELKLPTMISAMGDEAYELLVNLASPKKPAELTFDGASDLLRQHLQPTPSVLAERYRFRQRRQLPEESIADYVAELKKLARKCEFKEELNGNLRDQFVCGLKGDIMRQRLFAEDGNIDFVSAVRLATSLEAAERDAAAVEAGSGSEVLENAKVHKISAQVTARGQSVRGSGGRHTRPGRGGAVWKGAHKVAVVETQLPNRVNNDSCKGCGSTSHLYEGCRFRYFVCSRCKNAGHLRRMCPKAARGSVRGEYYSDRKFHYGEVDVSDRSSEEVEDASMDLHHLNLRDYKAV